jgi:hypothetical protein
MPTHLRGHPRLVRVLLLALLLGIPSLRAAGNGSELVIHKDGTTLYHRPGCPVIRDGKGVVALPRAQAEARGYTPHPDCDPAVATPGTGKAAGTSPPGAATVYVGGPKYYHRKKTCTKLGDDPKAMRLDEAVKKHWPCPACKAPILKRTNQPAIPGTNRRRSG